MLEISRKRNVKPRADRQCFACLQVIPKGSEAVFIRAREDDEPTNFHLHPDCHKKAIKYNLYNTEFKQGVFQKVETGLDFSVAPVTEYPF